MGQLCGILFVLTAYHSRHLNRFSNVSANWQGWRPLIHACVYDASCPIFDLISKRHLNKQCSRKTDNVPPHGFLTHLNAASIAANPARFSPIEDT
jgi:hypothetical protein